MMRAIQRRAPKRLGNTLLEIVATRTPEAEFYCDMVLAQLNMHIQVRFAVAARKLQAPTHRGRSPHES